MQERARTRARRSPEDPRYRAPIFTSRYCVRQLLKHGSIDERRRGSYVPEEDWWLARSRHNAFLSARRYLRRDEPAESKSSFDRQVRCSSSHLKRNFDTTSNNVKGESYFTRKRVIQTKQELMQRNLRCHSDGFDPTFPISTVRKDAKNVNRDGLNQTGCLNGNADDDELEEGQITPARGSFPSLSLSSSQPETGSNGSVSLIKYGENSCAINLTPTSKKKTKRSIDYSPSQFKKRKKRSSAESNIIVVCGQGSNRQQHHFLDNVKIASLLENANTRKDHQENDGRKRGLMLSNGLDLVSGKVGSEFNADVRMRIDGKFNTISAPIKFRCPAADEWKSLQQEDNAGEDKSIVHREDGQGSKSGDDSEMAGLSLQGDQIDQSKQRQDLSTYSDLTSQADLSLCIQHANVAGRNCWGVNCKRVEGSKGPVGALSATDKEIEKARDMGNSKDCGSLSKVDVMQGKMHEVITSVKENVSVPIKEAGLQVSKADSLFSEAVTNRVILPLHNCLPFDGNENVNSLGSVDSLISLTGLSLGLGISEAGPCKKERVKGVTDHLGVHTSDLPVKHVHPHINLVPASGNSEDIVPSQKFISTVGECGLQLDDIGEKRELGKPSFTEATCVSSLVPMTTAAANSSVFLDELDTILEAKQVDFMRATLNSDSLMAKLNVQQIDDMRCTMEPNISTALKDNYLNVLKQKKWGSSLDTDHPQSLSLPLFQTYKIVPSLLSWKRPASVAAHSRRINKKLQCLQTTQAFYSRSVDRFSMSHSAATSLGRSNFKWTKLIDKCTEKDNAEATIKAAAVEKWKGEGKDDLSGEDGKEKAKMLVAYEGSSCNTDSTHTRYTTNTPRIFTSRWLSNSGFKYIQAGNGNQPVRDPNTISCALASEKVRRRLHTVRSISSKKQQYCQFFTRFGKCNKEFGGICPYTHDSEKVVICTRFLKGNCVNMHCKLTHKVIPERMPDCSYFLLGVCTHESCPYRHVNVNPKAPICDGFLKGFCADNDKCKKKHTYVCPQYASNGECSERSICKFHHPRRKIESKLFSRVLKRNSKGRRYHFMTFEALRDFLSPSSVNLSGKEKKGAEEVSVENETAADYISLSASEEDITEDGMTEDNMGISQRCNAFSFEQGLQSDDSDMLLKPVLLLRR